MGAARAEARGREKRRRAGRCWAGSFMAAKRVTISLKGSRKRTAYVKSGEVRIDGMRRLRHLPDDMTGGTLPAELAVVRSTTPPDHA